MKSQLTYGYRLTACLLIFLYLVNPLRVFQPYLVYKVNQDYIATVLCVNKDKPKMECNGKCHLAKELKKAAEEESQNTQNRIVDGEANEITVENFTYLFFDHSQNISIVYPPLGNKVLSGTTILNTPPPQA